MDQPKHYQMIQRGNSFVQTISDMLMTLLKSHYCLHNTNKIELKSLDKCKSSQHHHFYDIREILEVYEAIYYFCDELPVQESAEKFIDWPRYSHGMRPNEIYFSI